MFTRTCLKTLNPLLKMDDREQLEKNSKWFISILLDATNF